VSFVTVQVLLDQGVGAQPAVTGRRPAVEIHAESLEVDRRTFFALLGTVGNWIELAFHLCAGGLEGEVGVSQGLHEQREHPAFAGHCRTGLPLRHARFMPLEDVPLINGVTPGDRNLIRKASTLGQAKVRGLLPGKLFASDALKDIEREQATFRVNGDVRHQRFPVGSRT
jgi:hypothetical protein